MTNERANSAVMQDTKGRRQRNARDAMKSIRMPDIDGSFRKIPDGRASVVDDIVMSMINSTDPLVDPGAVNWGTRQFPRAMPGSAASSTRRRRRPVLVDLNRERPDGRNPGRRGNSACAPDGAQAEG